MSEQSEALNTTASPAAAPSEPLVSMRQWACAWVGLWGVAAEDLGKFYQRCVARGEQLLKAQPSAAQSAMKLPAPVTDVTPPKSTVPKVIRPMSVFNAFGAVESYHVDLNAAGLLPTKQELDALSERVEALAREVDTLAKQREA